MKRLISCLFLLSALLLGRCNPQKEQSAEWWIDRAIEAHGGSAYDSLAIGFTFREKRYKVINQGGAFDYQRIFTDSLGQKIVDQLTNSGFKRFIDDTLATIPEEKAFAYSNSVNSVAYFMLIPSVLRAPAVIAEKAGTETIKGKAYQRIKVMFRKEGGGADFDDVFMYWIGNDSKRVDYLAYRYHTDGGGVRFRSAYNSRTVRGILISDYQNYKPKKVSTPLSELGGLYENNQLDRVSVIENEKVMGL